MLQQIQVVSMLVGLVAAGSMCALAFTAWQSDSQGVAFAAILPVCAVAAIACIIPAARPYRPHIIAGCCYASGVAFGMFGFHGIDRVPPQTSTLQAFSGAEPQYVMLALMVIFDAPQIHVIGGSFTMLLVFLLGLLDEQPDAGVEYESYALRLLALVALITISRTAYVNTRRGWRLQFLARKDLTIEKKRSNDLLLSLLPTPVVQRMLENPRAGIADHFDNVTILQSDIVNFTQTSHTLSPADVSRFLNIMFTAFDKALERFGVYKMYTIGDAYIVAGGIPGTNTDEHAQRVVDFGLHMQHVMRTEVNPQCTQLHLPDNLQIRLGISTGEATFGVVGRDKPAYLGWGAAIEDAERHEQQGQPGKVLVSHATWDMVTQQDPAGKAAYDVEQVAVAHPHSSGTAPAYLISPRSKQTDNQ